MDEPVILDVDGVADLLKVHPVSVRRWVADGTLTPLRYGGVLRFDRAAVLAAGTSASDHVTG